MYLQALSEGSRICMQRQITFGGGVSPRGTLLRGQSIIEYVLIIAVISLVIVFAGPGVVGAIRNQFNLVGNTVNSGATGGVEGGASGGGSAGADSATVQAAIAKDAKDWTLGEQEAVAEDIAKNGTSSIAYAKAEAAMKAKTQWTIMLNNGQMMRYEIVGISHDDLADGSGKAGLTFWAHGSKSFDFKPDTCAANHNPLRDNIGGWEKSELRQRLNSGDLWNLFPMGLRERIKAVKKETVENNTKIVTVDKMPIIGNTEIYGAWDLGGYQYEYWSSQGLKAGNFATTFWNIRPLFCF